jgi:hypothetical protein
MFLFLESSITCLTFYIHLWLIYWLSRSNWLIQTVLQFMYRILDTETCFAFPGVSEVAKHSLRNSRLSRFVYWVSDWNDGVESGLMGSNAVKFGEKEENLETRPPSTPAPRTWKGREGDAMLTIWSEGRFHNAAKRWWGERRGSYNLKPSQNCCCPYPEVRVCVSPNYTAYPCRYLSPLNYFYWPS